MKHLLFAAAVAFATPAFAADLYTPVPEPIPVEAFESRWEFNAALYLWAPGINGDVGVGNIGPVDVDADFLDILDNLDMAFMGLAEARYDRFGVMADILYTKLSADGTGPLGVFEADVSTEMFVGTLMAEYRLIDAGPSSLDILAGARLWGVTGDIEITSGLGMGTSADSDEYWVDPMIGVKGRLQGASPFYLTGWAMIGGFGVSSEIDWDLFGGVGYEVNDRFSLVAGYRGTGVDYESDDFEFDVIQHGPIFGGVFHF